MRKTFLLFAAFVLSWLGGKAVAENVTMPQFGHQTVTVSAGSPVTFMDMNSYAGISSNNSNNSFATTIFEPAEAGNSIKIEFEDIDVRNDGTNYPANLSIYNGVFDVTTVTYPTATSGVTASSAFPATDKLVEKLDGTYTNRTYISADATGALSVCYVYRYAKAIQGWKATVSSITLEAMTVQSASANYDFVDTEVWSGKQSVAMAGFGITTEGYSSPDKLQTLTFTVEQAGVIDPTALKLYAGQAASAAGLTALAGTISESAGVYTYTLDEPYALSNGNNKFMLAGDVLSSAAFNATAKVNVTGIATVSGFTTFTTATPAEMKVAAMYLMTTDATYSINQETLFYDDGGKDGNISLNFNGKVLFEPATAGQKVSLTFNTIHLFYTDYAASNQGYVDWLYVYNGNSTDSKDLLWQAVQADYTTPVVIKSTADNGALTVVHRSQANSSNLKAGWEATVNTFVPQPMEVKTAVNTKQTDATVSAGTENVQVASIKLTTEETEPALVVKELAFNTNNTNSQIGKAKLYYTKDNTFATTTLLGEVDVTADKVTLTATNAVNFREGDNYLWLAYDIQPLAANDEKVDVMLEKLSFTNNTDYTAFATIEGNLTIKNVAIQACGSQTITIQGDWQYTHTVTSQYSSRYMYEQCDQTIVFRPATTGNVIQIDYTDFDVYYSSSDYGVRAKYIVYAGEGTSGEKLWELDANGKKPTQIRSNAANGAITIVFNPNTTTSSYTGNGWHATVKEYTPKNMEVTGVAVEQASTKLVTLGEEKAALLDLTVATEGTLNPLTLDAVTVSLKGTEANISKVYLLQDGVVLAVAEAAATVTLTLATPAELSEYDNAFQIAVDVREDATIDATIDAAISGLTVSGSAQAVTAGDPEGNRTIKNVYCLQAGDNGTKTIGANSLMFYDDGCADGQYTKNIEGYVTFKPTTEGCAVELVVNSYKLSNSAPVKIYYGTSHDGDADATVEYNYSEPIKYVGQSFISSAEDGSLTVYFKDGGSITNEGWEFEIREHLLTPLTIESVTATSIASGMQTVGAKNLKMLQVAVTVIGDNTPITIDAITVAANEYADGTKLYQTGKVATFSDSELFTAPYAISERGTYYFWVTADASEDAEDDDVMTVSLTSIKSGANTIDPTTAEIAQTKLAHGMRGSYAIGNDATSDFKTVAEAIEAMNTLGIEGNVVFNIAAGNYTEQVTLPEVNGTSADATITFCAESGNASDVVFSNNSTSDTEGVWTVNGMDWLTLKNLSFKSGKEGTASVLVFKNNSEHCTIDGCTLTSTATVGSTTQTCHLIRLIAGSEANQNINYFVLENSTLNGGYTGVNMAGTNASLPNTNNIQILNNHFNEQAKQMVYGTMLKDVTITGNTMTNSNTTQSDMRAIDLRTKLEGNILISGNTITINATGSGYVSAVYLAPTSATNCPEGTVANIYNNAISVTDNANSASSCVRLKWMRGVNLTYNTLLINGTYSSTSALWLENFTNLALTATNNLIQNIGTGNAIFGVKGTYSHNALYSQSGSINNSNADFAAWKNAVTDADDNLNEQAVFASNSLLLLKEAGNLVSATPVATITTDILGKERHATTPTIGAYEYDADLFRVPVMEEGYPKAQNIKDLSTEIVVKADNMGTAKVLVLAATEAAPSKETVLADGQEVVLQKDAETSVTIDGLTEETAYKAYVVLLSPVGDAADAVSATGEFTTAWTLRPVELASIAAQTVSENAAVTLTATLATEYEQAKPYSYKWYTAFDETEIGNAATLNATATRSTEYICLVTDKWGQKAYVSAHVHVTKATTMASFEEYNLPANGHKHVDEAWVNETETYLYSGTYAFANEPNKAYDAYNGYAICSDKSTEATRNYKIDQFRSAAGGAYDGNNFAVAYYSAPNGSFAGYTDPITLTNTTEPQTISGFYITNTVYTLDAILKGDYTNGAFDEGDYLSLTISGYNGTTKTGDVVFYLADYRDGKRNALDTWEWLDLSSLGAVTRLEFEMYTTKSDKYGFTTPTYFCLDNFGGAVSEPEYVAARSELEVGRYYTVCLNKAVSAVRGASFWKIEKRDEASTVVYLEEENPTTATAGTPFIIQATAPALEVVYTGDATTIAGTNGALHGTLENMTYDDLSGGSIYLLIQNAIRPVSTGNYLSANRAYINYDDLTVAPVAPLSVPGRRVRAIPMNGQVATGMGEVQGDNEQCTKVLINGQLYIMHNGTMYNVQGQLIK